MKHRVEIDGLRALAVIPVILFHAGFKLFNGGFVGVDVFFVVSGYLITTILIEDIENKRLSIFNFYARRARRILPALVLVSFVSIIAAWMLLGSVALDKFGNGIIGISFFVSNIVFWHSEGYFTGAAELNPILHTWSLAVEEQYYLLFPIFLFLAWRFGKNNVFWMIVLFASVSLALSEWAWRKGGGYATANFFFSPTRAWELLAGSIAAFIVKERGVQANNNLANIGLAAIVFALFAYDESTPFPSVYALVPVLGVVLLVLYAERRTLVARLLSSKAFVGIGLISYSAYLWHQPLFAFYRTYQGELDISFTASIALISITLTLATFTWKFVETPFRSRNILSANKILTLTLVTLSLLATFGYLSKVASKGYEDKLSKTLAENGFIYFENMNERKFVAARLRGKLRDTDHVFVGSSRIMQINSEIMQDKILNLAVGGATIEDDLAFLLEAVAKLNPKFVYLGADPWLLNSKAQSMRSSVRDDLYEYWQKVIDSKDLDNKYLFFDETEVSSEVSLFERVVKSIRVIMSLKSGESIPLNGEIEAVAKKAYDGSYIYNEEAASINPEKISAKFNSALNYSMKDFAYDREAEEILISLVGYLQRKGIEIIFVLSPYHPGLFDRMQTEKPLFLKLEGKFRDIAKAMNVKVAGSYDPAVVGCKDHEFYDGMHPKTVCMHKVVSDLQSKQNDL